MEALHNPLIDRAILCGDKIAQTVLLEQGVTTTDPLLARVESDLCTALRAFNHSDNQLVLETLAAFEERSDAYAALYRVHVATMQATVLHRLHLIEEGLRRLIAAERDDNRPIERLAIAWRRGALYRTLGRLPDAMLALTAAYDRATDLGLLEVAAYVQAEMASVTSAMGDDIKAVMMYEQSLLAIPLNVSTRDYVAKIRMNLASVYQGLGRDAEALREYETYKQENGDAADPQLYAIVQLNKAIAQRNLGLAAEADESYRAVLRFADDNANVEFQIRALIGLAYVSEMVGDVDRGADFADEAVRRATAAEAQPLMGEALAAVASLEKQQGNIPQAITTLRRVFRLFVDASNIRRAVQIGAMLVDWLVDEERYQEAVGIQKECSRLQASVVEREMEHTIQITKARAQLESDREQLRTREEERTRVLQSVLPLHIADRLMNGETHIADRISDVTILFADIVGFTTLAAETEPEQLITLLEELFRAFDSVCANHNCERIKTIGDSYMAVSKAQDDAIRQTENLVRVALDIMRGTTSLPIPPGRLRIGIHCGAVIAGVMSGERLSYDIWGDTVNVAARMEQYSLPGRILCTTEVAQRISDIPDIVVTQREPIDVRGKGSMVTYWVASPSS
jgi:class 3 adenylate cyclase